MSYIIVRFCLHYGRKPGPHSGSSRENRGFNQGSLGTCMDSFLQVSLVKLDKLTHERLISRNKPISPIFASLKCYFS